jgi:hypothetical protein
MEFSSMKLQPTEFDGTNWHAYKQKTLAYAYGLDAMKVLEGTEVLDSPPRDATEFDKTSYKTFKTKQRKLYSYLTNTQKGDLGLTHFNGLEIGDVEAAWKALQGFV